MSLADVAPGSRVARYATRAMGSRLALTVLGAPSAQADAAWGAVVAEFAAAESELSRFRATSDLTRLNLAAGGEEWTAVGRRTAAFLTGAWRAQRMTQGRFDPRVLDVLEALGERAGVTLPSPGQAVAALERTPEGAADRRDWLVRDGRPPRFAVREPVDSGGLGKGLALRWALREARRAAPGATGILLDAGGDIAASGAGPGDGPWMIGLEDPAGGEEPLAVIGARDLAVATSSTRLRLWTGPDGAEVHHLIDPATRAPARSGLRAVTVALPDPAWAEVWTKALFLAGAAGIGPEARARGLAAWWVELDGSLHLTPAARAATPWTRAEARATAHAEMAG